MDNKVVTLKTKDVQDREQLDTIMAELNRLHAAGELFAVMVYYTTKDGENFTWTSNSLKLNEMAWGISLLEHSLHRYIGPPE